MSATAPIYEMDQERDQKTCVALDLKVSGANKELAQWLLDHPRYSAPTVAAWLSCGVSRIKDLRAWAESGFADEFHPSKRRRQRENRRISGVDELETLDNSENSEEVADPATIEDNVLHTITRINEHARLFKKLFKISGLDREAGIRIATAIDRMIDRWRSAKSALAKRENNHD